MRKLFSLFLALVATTSLWAYDFQSGNLYYKITSETTVEVTAATATITWALIPSSVSFNNTTYVVTSIGDNAFKDCSSLSYTDIPNSIISIGEDAFYNTKIYNTSWENGSLYIDDCLIKVSDALGCSSMYYAYEINNDTRLIASGAFRDCSCITNITIPNSVTSIGKSAFYGCSSLNSIPIPNSVTNIGAEAFKGCSSFTRIDIPNGVTSIGDETFADCSSLTWINIPNSVTEVGAGAFKGCSSLTRVNIPNSVTEVGGGLFAYCKNLTSVVLPENIKSLDARYNEYYTILYGFFEGCSSLTSFTIPNSVTCIAENAFASCVSLKSVKIPESVYCISEHAFANCSSLTSISLPDSITIIDYSTFSGCSSLISITIPDSVKTILWEAFKGCSSLTHINIPINVTSIGEETFEGCSAIKSIVWEAKNCTCSYPFKSSTNTESFIFGDEVESIPDGLCSGMEKLKSIYLPNRVSSIGTQAFSNCSALTSITVPNTVMDIGPAAFFNCSSLKNITIPDGVTSIGDRTFEGCRSLTSVTIPNSVTSIGNYAFDECSALTSVTIPNSVTSIGNYAFDECSALASVTIGNSVTSIGYYAFNGCSSLTSLTIGNSVTSIGYYAFNGCSSLISVTIPNSVTSIGGSAFSNCSSLTSVTIPESVTSIGGYAFYKCSSLTSIIIPDGVTTIEYWTFAGCSSLASVSIGENVANIDVNAFYECSALTSVVWNAKNCADFSGKENVYGDWITDAPFYYGSRKQITYFVFGENVEHIPAYLCYETPLDSITFKAIMPPTIGDGVFFGVSRDIPVYIPCNSKTVYCKELPRFTNYQDIPSEYTVAIFSQNSLMGSAKVDTHTPCETTISATPNFGYHFTQWSDGVADNPRTFVITQDTIFTAEFAPNNYTISTQSSDRDRGTTSGDMTTTYLNYATISAAANYGYHFTQWSDGNTDNPRQVQVTEDKTYTAYFDKNIYNISLQSNNGTIESATQAAYLDSVAMMANADYGYHFTQWSDGVADNPRTFVITQDTTFTAEFAPNNYTISTQSSDTERGTTSDDMTTVYLDYVTISAAANYGYHFTQWSDGNTDNPRQVQVTEDKTYTAYFDKNTYYIAKNCNSNQGYVDGYSSGEYLDNITLTAEPNYGYHFVQWSDGVADNPRHFILTQDTTFSAEFAQTFSGRCGDSLYWSYDETAKTISITGSGEMYDYTKSTQPWLLFKEEIKEVTISNTTTSIGTSAFEGCISLCKLSIGTAMKNIGDNAFAGCNRLYDIYVYATYPPFADESSFANYNVYVYIPCEYQRDYILDVVWGKFKFIECIDSEEATTDGNVTVVPGFNDVTITWPTEGNADTYTIVIKKGNEVFCTLTFNAEGQLLNIAFAPGRDGNHPAQYAEAVANGKGFRFTVTGLEEGTDYTYDITVKDASNQTINSHTGAFTTQSTTAVDNIPSPISNSQKLLRNGQLYIYHNGSTYNAMGMEL